VLVARMTDLTKPVQTACGYPARVLATDLKGVWPVLAVFEYEGVDYNIRLRADGTHHNALKFLVNVPPPEPLMVTIRMTPEDAAELAWQNELFRKASFSTHKWTRGALFDHFRALAESQREEV